MLVWSANKAASAYYHTYLGPWGRGQRTQGQGPGDAFIDGASRWTSWFPKNVDSADLIPFPSKKRFCDLYNGRNTRMTHAKFFCASKGTNTTSFAAVCALNGAQALLLLLLLLYLVPAVFATAVCILLCINVFFQHVHAFLRCPWVFSRALGCKARRGARLYTTAQVWVPGRLRGACSGRSKSRNLASNHGVAFRRAKAEQDNGKPTAAVVERSNTVTIASIFPRSYIYGHNYARLDHCYTCAVMM